MKKIEVKAFIAATTSLWDYPEKLDAFLKDKRLSTSEKVILKNLVLLRGNKNNEVIEALSTFICSNDFVELQRNYVLGLAYNNAGKLTEAIPYLRKAHILSLEVNNQGFKVQTLFNLFNAHYNLRELQQCRLLFRESQEYEATNVRDEIYLLRIAFSHAILGHKKNLAAQAISRLDELKSYMAEYSQVGYLYDKIDYYLSEENLEAIDLCLAELKGFRKYYQTINYKLMKSLLDFLRNGSPIYLYEVDFKDAPVMWWHIRVLQELQENNRKKAEEYWMLLHKSSPEAFERPFQYKGGKNFFFLCLQKLRANQARSIAPSEGRQLLKEQALIDYLRSLESPIRKEDLFKLVYGTDPVDKSDMNKLQSMIKRLRIKFKTEIKFSRNCYFVDKDTKAS